MKWINPEGYDCVKDIEKSSWWKAIYHLKLDRNNPLILEDDDGTQYRTSWEYWTDMGSVPRFPPIAQCVVPKDRFLSFFPHDQCYEFGTIWKRRPYADLDGKIAYTPWMEYDVTREFADDLLYRGALCDPIKPWKITAYIVWKQVRLWGKGNFNQRTELPPPPPPPAMKYPVALA